MVIFSLICQLTLESQDIPVCDHHALDMPPVQEGKVVIYNCDDDVDCEFCQKKLIKE